MNKTLIGKEDYLFLINDSCNELGSQCSEVIPNIKIPNHLDFNNYILIVFPNKSLILNQYLPERYNGKYRHAVNIYKRHLKEKLLDGYEYLKDENDVYYKTDTHINLKGGYIVYKKFIEKINELFNCNLEVEVINIEVKSCILKDLCRGVGDLTWEINLGNQVLDDITDNYYYSNDMLDFYIYYIIKNENSIKFLDYELNDNTLLLENQNTSWDILSKYIVYKKNEQCKHRVLIFYDSFLLSTLPLYLKLFSEVYLVKSVYRNDLIKLIKPKYVFEFRVERFMF
jgi:hypothetical protein